MVSGFDRSHSKRHVSGVFVIAVCATLCGCSRSQYRVEADNEVRQLLSERTLPEYLIPERCVHPRTQSRMADYSDPDCGPLPPDDPEAGRLMDAPYKSRASRIWGERGRLEKVEFDHWQSFLPRDDEGDVRLNRRTSMELALLHSRDYQANVESVYLQALPVSLQRFQFDAQWLGGGGISFTNFGGNTVGSSRELSLTDNLGLRKRFATGGQLIADLSNALAWDYQNGVSSALSTLSFQFLQPLMRQAFREVQLEPLTQAERDLLYSVRDFARFRRTFFVDTVGTDGYLGLLATAQAIRNAEANLESLRRNLEEHDALLLEQQVSQFQVDQVYQEYEQGRLSVLQANARYNTALDVYKIQLGLPPTLELSLDDDELQQFELNDPRLEKLNEQNEINRKAVLQFSKTELPKIAELEKLYAACEVVGKQIPGFAKAIETELEDWKKKSDLQTPAEEQADADDNDANKSTSQSEGENGDPETNAEDPEQSVSDEAATKSESKPAAEPTAAEAEQQRQEELAERLTKLSNEIKRDIPDDLDLLKTIRKTIDDGDARKAWEQLTELCGKNFRARVGELFVLQTQVRVYRIETRELKISEESAMWLAERNRLDLKNVQGQVVDAYRRTEVAADLLEADLTLDLVVDLNTDPARDNPLRFDESNSTFRAGLRFDGPLNRMAERNIYRASQIEYQRARRSFMVARDQIQLEVRTILRNLNLNRFQFEITRQQLITAARQVEQAQFNLRDAREPDSNLTRDLLTALERLLTARNSLISSWVSYENSRMLVQEALGVLQVDDSGSWINDGQSFNDIINNDITDAVEQVRPVF